MKSTHHQWYEKYREYSGKQYTSKAYLASVFSSSHNISIWEILDIGHILEQGDQVFNDVCKDVGVIQPLAVDELPLNIYIKENLVSSKTLAHESRLLVKKDNISENYKHYDASEKSNEALLTFTGFSVAILWSENKLSSSNYQVVSSSQLLIFISLKKMFSEGNKEKNNTKQAKQKFQKIFKCHHHGKNQTNSLKCAEKNYITPNSELLNKE